ncbi:MAG: hypothetical protein LRY73_10100 [Bacillus sp. (in: Bacteria)]|nr:hypothetical protein [Bacillus sp. (in: firmicutes)]
MKLLILIYLMTSTVGGHGDISGLITDEDLPPPLEQSMMDVGYQSVEGALKDCNKLFKEEIKLPFKLPPVPFTHQMGKCTNVEGEWNDSFEVEYLNEQDPKKHYMIRVKPEEYGIDFPERYIKETYPLENGTLAYYTTELVSGFNILFFKDNGWQYNISINKNAADNVPPEVLLEIANSIH